MWVTLSEQFELDEVPRGLQGHTRSTVLETYCRDCETLRYDFHMNKDSKELLLGALYVMGIKAVPCYIPERPEYFYIRERRG